MPPLDAHSIEILRALRKQGWLSTGELALALDLPGWKVRSVLGELRRCHLVQRGNSAHGRWGTYSITERGLVELAGSEQLRIV